MSFVSTRWLSASAGFLAWAIVPVALVVEAGDRSGTRTAMALVASAVMAVAYAVVVLPREPRRRCARIALCVQVAAALVACAASGVEFAPILLVLVAAQAPTLLPLGAAALLVVGQTLVVAALCVALEGWDSLLSMVAWAAFEGFSFAAVDFARREAEARISLVQTQQALAEAHRAAERLHIARELHDRLGHLLTALCLQLEVAARAPDGAGTKALDEARRLARDLLTEVRATVGAIRESGTFDLGPALAGLGRGIERPRVELSIEDAPGLGVEESLVLFRCAQEGFTNALRHADAQVVSMRLGREEAGWVLEVSDDGRGCATPTPGNGLTGLRERVEAVGGTFSLSSDPGRGFTVRAQVRDGGVR